MYCCAWLIVGHSRSPFAAVDERYSVGRVVADQHSSAYDVMYVMPSWGKANPAG